MKKEILEQYYSRNSLKYRSLAAECGSVIELIFRLRVFNDRWQSYDWAMFFVYLYTESKNRNMHMFRDIVETIRSSTELDGILTNKRVLGAFIEIGTKFEEGHPMYNACMAILAGVFMKFPDLWKMNWMWIRHRPKKCPAYRTHRLSPYVDHDHSDRDYFESAAFLDDFVRKYADGGYAKLFPGE